MPTTYYVTLSAPFLDCGDSSQFVCELADLNGATALAAIEQHDADLAGLPVEEAAGFTLLSFVVSGNEAVAVVRTEGLGPRAEDNCLCTAHFSTQGVLKCPS
jgi:hypothetical protein